MRRCVMVFTAMVVLAITAPAGYAGVANPHFVGTPTCSVATNGVLTCSGKAAGLDARATFAYLSTTGASAVYRCVNRGQNLPPGQPVVSGPADGTWQEIAVHNGNITFSPSLGPPATPAVGDNCPNGKNWTLRLVSITYYGVTIHIVQGTGDILTDPIGTVTGPV